MLAKNVTSELNQLRTDNKMNFKFSVFDNLNRTTNVSLNRTIVKTNEMTNNRNKLKAFIGSFTDIHRNVRAKILKKVENAVTVKNMRSFEIGMTKIDNLPVVIAYTTENAVIVCSENNRWKAFGSDLTLVYAKDRQNFVQQYVGDFIEIKEEIEFPTEQKVDVLSNEMDELRKEVQALKQKNAELNKENSVFRKNLKGEELSFDEELIIAMASIQEVTASENNEVFTTSNESTVFIVSNTEEKTNEPMIVSNDQLTDLKENKMPLYDYQCTKCSKEFEQRRSISERQTTECPECHSVAKQQLTAPAGISDGYYNPGKMYINRNKQTFKSAKR
ncbi:FmdB family zinc ribbon protein [Kluyvera intermedia]|uniref:FmdB family zinc ribbon protein n=2 Tax=Kluyvera intermedia TaxID=61648 RepID=UPI00370D4EC8